MTDVSLAPVTYSLGISLDGYIAGPDGRFDWSRPDEELFAYATDEVRELKVHFMGRRLYETMAYWDTPEAVDSSQSELELEFARLWRALPKVVFSTTLSGVAGSMTELATNTVAEEIALWRSRPGRGPIAVGGAGLAATVAEAGLIDEYRARIYPVYVGGGTPFYPQGHPERALELLSTRVFDNGVIAMRHRVLRES